MTTVTRAEILALRQSMPLAFRPSMEMRLKRWGLMLGFTALFAWCLYDFGFTPERIINGLSRLGRVLSFMFPPHIWTEWDQVSDILTGLGETLAMAFLGTLLGAVVAFPLSFLGAKNINRFAFFRFGVRRGFDIIRAFETLILALVFIRAFGLGPLPGVLAIAVGEIGVLAKLYAEAIEKQLEWLPSGNDAVLRFARPNGWEIVTNFGAEPFERLFDALFRHGIGDDLDGGRHLPRHHRGEGWQSR